MVFVQSAVRDSGGCASLVTAELPEGSWGAASHGNVMVVGWPGDNTTLKAGDRLVGLILITSTRIYSVMTCAILVLTAHTISVNPA